VGLAVRVIPTMLCRGRQLIKGVAFDSWRSVGLVTQAVRIHQARGVDELVLLDIEATNERRGPDLELVAELADWCFMPLAVGGGVRSVADARALLRAGADKVVVRGLIFENPYEVRRIADACGSQALVASIDVTYGLAWAGGSRYLTMKPVTWARYSVALGAGEILLTSVEREGTLQGYDLQTINWVSTAVGVPVIAHGGAGKYQHLAEAVMAGASAVAAGAMFQFTQATPRGAAEYLAAHGVEVRL